MSDLIELGSRVWLRTGNAWLQGTVKALDDKLVQVSTDDGQSVQEQKENLHLANPIAMDTLDDLTNLSFLHEPAVLHTLDMRYGEESIYTYSGIVLIAVNPFARLPLYSAEIAQLYSGKRRGELDPHLYAVAEEAFREMSDYGKNQTIIVSGESGAGKTISAKYIMRYFANIDQLSYHVSSAGGGEFSASQVEQQVLATNPIMEAFGNAKTVRNDNSSRFGKYIQIYFDDHETTISGANMRTYLLERSRVVFQPENERNYHIFYQLCAGVPNAEKKQLALSTFENFHYLNQGGVHGIPGVDDAAEFQETVKALSTVGISVSKQWDIFKLLAVILHIGNIKLSQSDDGNSCLIDSKDAGIKYTCRLLGIDPDELVKWLTNKRIVTRNDVIVTQIGLTQGMSARDAFAKYLYHHLFDWLVVQVNASLENAGMHNSPSSNILSSYIDSDVQDKNPKRFIAVLDIYGFEHFKRNSFEQFCINYANEKLQQEFNQHVFKLEQEEYVKEKIQWSFIDFNDNKPCLDLIEGKLGIMDLLDEESRLPSGSDTSLVSKLFQQFSSKPNSNSSFAKPRFSNTAFTVRHYAHPVDYEIEGFIDKNKDTMPEEILSLLHNSSLEILHELLGSMSAETKSKDDSGKSIARKGKPTLGSSFKLSLKSLMEIINTTSVHYIRCIKPNEQKKPFVFDSEYVLQQLRACGVLETIRISCAGYPSRFALAEFSDRFRILVPSGKRVKKDEEMCRIVLETVIGDPDKYQVGLTKIFLRAGQLAYLEKLRSSRLNAAAILLQKNIKCHQARSKFIKMRNVALSVQTAFRGYLARLQFQKMRQDRAAIAIQRHVRGFLARNAYSKTQQVLVILQSQCRTFLVRRSFIKQKTEDRIVKIQAICRGFMYRKGFKQYQYRVIVCQSSVRRWLAKRELKRLRIEAKSIQGVQQKAGALEKKVFELTQLLAAKESTCRDLEANSVSVQNQLTNAKLEIDKLKKSNVEKFAVLNNATILLREQVRQSHDNNEKLKSQLESVNTELANLNRTYETTLKELKSAKPVANEHDSDHIKELEHKMQYLQNENQQLKAKLAKSIRGGKSHMKTDSNASFSASQSPISPSKTLEETKTLTEKTSSRRSSHRRHGSLDSAVINDLALSSKILISPSEMTKLLGSNVLLEELHALVSDLSIPHLSVDSQPTRDSVLVTAKIFGEVVLQMWLNEQSGPMKLAFESLITDVRSTVNWSEDSSCAFWLANLYHLLCILTSSEERIRIRESTHKNSVETGLDYCEHVVEKFLSDLEGLMKEIYYRWLADLKRRLFMFGPAAVLEHQGLPEYIDNPSSSSLNSIGFITKWMSSTVADVQAKSMDNLLAWFSKLEQTLKSFYVEDNLHRQLVVTLVRLLGTSSFNQLMMRKNFCSWRRGMQIQYNCVRIDEWCGKHNLSEASLHMEPLMQAAKLFQLNKSKVEDLETIYDVCFLLSPLQIKKLLSIYRSDEYDEHSVSKQVMDLSISRCLNDKDFELMLDTNDESPLMMPTPVSAPRDNITIPSDISNNIVIIKQILDS